MVFRCHPKDLKSRSKLSYSANSENCESSSDEEGDQDDMLYIPVDSDDEIIVRSAGSDRSYSSASESSDSSSSGSPASRYTHKTIDGERCARVYQFGTFYSRLCRIV